MSNKRIALLIVVIISCLCFFSCENVEYKGSEVVIEEIVPSNEDSGVNNNKNVSIKPSLNVAKYLIRMIPADVNTNAVVFGDTRKSNVLINGKTYTSFKEVSPESIQRIGYVSQGSWLVTIIALDSNNEEIYVFGGKSGANPDYSSIEYSYGELVYINSDSASISINLEEAIGTGTTGSITLNNYKFRLVSDIEKYGKQEKDGILVRVILESLDGAYSQTKTIDVNNTNVFTVTKDDGSIDTSVALINNLEIANQIPNGLYSLKVIMYENNGSTWVEAAGVTYSFTAISDLNTVISTGSSSEIDLDPYDYVSPGASESGIIIDSGINAEISITSSVSGTVNVDTPVTFTGKVNETETVGYWLVNGDKASMQSGKTFTYTPTSSDAGKTVTITYMILDSSYNTISTNYYLSVNASTSTT